MIIDKPPEQLAREDLIRQTLELAATSLEEKQVNQTYRWAFAKAARIIRDLKETLNKTEMTTDEKSVS